MLQLKTQPNTTAQNTTTPQQCSSTHHFIEHFNNLAQQTTAQPNATSQHTITTQHYRPNTTPQHATLTEHPNTILSSPP